VFSFSVLKVARKSCAFACHATRNFLYFPYSVLNNPSISARGSATFVIVAPVLGTGPGSLRSSILRVLPQVISSTVPPGYSGLVITAIKASTTSSIGIHSPSPIQPSREVQKGVRTLPGAMATTRTPFAGSMGAMDLTKLLMAALEAA
jgi:hypothetical protein